MSDIFDKNRDSQLLQSLKSLGLREKEGVVYLALLGLGSVGSSRIIKSTELHGQYVYQALDMLEERGLVEHVIERGRKKFSAKNPRALVRLIERQKQTADSLAAELQSRLILPTEQRSEVFRGRESFLAHELEMLEAVEQESELLVIGGSGDQFQKTMGKELEGYETARINKKILVRYIGSEAQRAELTKSKQGREFFDFKTLPGLFTGAVNTNITTKAIWFNIFGEPVTSFSVLHPVVAGSYRMFFETLWKLAR